MTRVNLRRPISTRNRVRAIPAFGAAVTAPILLRRSANAQASGTALAIFSCQGSWNACLEPLIFIYSADLFTLPLGLAYFRQANYTDWPVLMAGAVISTVPIAIFYVVFQRWFVEGQVSSGIKG